MKALRVLAKQLSHKFCYCRYLPSRSTYFWEKFPTFLVDFFEIEIRYCLFCFPISSCWILFISVLDRKLVAEADMEIGSFATDNNATFTLASEDHTMANAVRFVLNQELVSSS